jgi:hypothetical protein
VLTGFHRKHFSTEVLLCFYYFDTYSLHLEKYLIITSSAPTELISTLDVIFCKYKGIKDLNQQIFVEHDVKHPNPNPEHDYDQM